MFDAFYCFNNGAIKVSRLEATENVDLEVEGYSGLVLPFERHGFNKGCQGWWYHHLKGMVLLKAVLGFVIDCIKLSQQEQGCWVHFSAQSVIMGNG